ncbi:MAG TPA: Zn-ribbon domain-containing OB-fold protein [Caldithrix abyssi]|uniref:Zn-ribbon domain-containing OB-fold protein n=1 Tax=Caldithrix abyssi TaxID=187145 RepID=A0A7V4U1I6_CALAY|nr:Zn-ribbon domain-containing OB-fold protein [Caldithrix abyssi]
MDIPRYWRLREQRYKLQGNVCAECKAYNFPPRPVCLQCKSKNMQPYQFKGNGTIYSYSTVYQAPDAFNKQVPYLVALIDLDEGPRITARLTDILDNKIEIGMPVEMVIRKIYEDGDNGPIQYGYMFRPLLKKKE